MKKSVLILVLALLLAVQAQAGLEWQVTGSTAGTGNPLDVLPGDELTMVLNATDGDLCTGIRCGGITDSGADGRFTNWHVNPAFALRDGGGDAILGYIGWEFRNLPVIPWPWPEPWPWPFPWPYDDYDVYWIDAVSTGETVTEDILTLYYWVGQDSGEVHIQAFSDPTGLLGPGSDIRLLSGPVPMPDIMLNVIPEPTTLALLGLGGILLRRRRDQYSR